MVEVTRSMMQKFEFKETHIHGLMEIVPFYSDDLRGSFLKDYSVEVFHANAISHEVKEVFYSTSHKGVVRGLHFQRIKEQAKLVRCVCGSIWDVVVDLRKNSPTFKKWQAFDLTEENRHEVLVPAGCAHGFIALEDSLVSYKCDEIFYGEYDDGILWNDSDLNLPWPVNKVGGADQVILSEKDKMLQSFSDFMKTYGGL